MGNNAERLIQDLELLVARIRATGDSFDWSSVNCGFHIHNQKAKAAQAMVDSLSDEHATFIEGGDELFGWYDGKCGPKIRVSGYVTQEETLEK